MATYVELKAQLAELARQTEKAKAVEVQAVIDDIRAKVAEYGLTEKDIFGPRRRAQAKRAFTGVPRYRDPKTGAEWTGHGRAPAWIRDVKDRTKFLIAGSAGRAPVRHPSRTAAGKRAATKKASSTAAAPARKGRPKGKQAPKYRNPETGATWSGRGPAPAWLAAEKDRSKFLIDRAAA
jgi:DNA-binding protein H-NS